MFATFRKSGNITLLNDLLIMSLNGSGSSVLNSFNVCVAMLLGSMDLFGLMQLIKNSMSAGGAREREIVSSVIWPR